MTEPLDLTAFALELKAAQDHSTPAELISDRVVGFDKASGYRVAARLHELRMQEGAKPVARKIGFTNPAAWAGLGVTEPVWSYVDDRTTTWISSREITCPIGAFLEPKIEPEIMVHFRTTPPVTDDLDAIAASIDWIAHGFEIVQSHFRGWKFKAADAIAISVLHAALLIGEPHDVSEFGPELVSDLEKFTVTLSCDGQVREVGKGTNVLGSPLKAIAALMTVLAEQDAAPLQPGELITTGSLTAALPIKVGETWTTELNGLALPGLSITFTA